MQKVSREPFGMDWYLLSDVALELASASPNSTEGAFKATIGGNPYHPK